jgi:8-oxo-dGTP pyrophosphatase MutT (NUDIX family)
MNPHSLREVTLCFLVRKDEILLAMKKRGFGKGRWNGVGGKLDADESVEAATIRETLEEIGVTPTKLEKVAELTFLFPTLPADKNFNQFCHVFFAHSWEGEPTESEEMAPAWYPKNALPYANMWPDDELWLEQVLAGKKLVGEFSFGDNDSVLAHNISYVSSLES